jgi:hypothetical protein
MASSSVGRVSIRRKGKEEMGSQQQPTPCGESHHFTEEEEEEHESIRHAPVRSIRRDAAIKFACDFLSSCAAMSTRGSASSSQPIHSHHGDSFPVTSREKCLLIISEKLSRENVVVVDCRIRPFDAHLLTAGVFFFFLLFSQP